MASGNRTFCLTIGPPITCNLCNTVSSGSVEHAREVSVLHHHWIVHLQFVGTNRTIRWNAIPWVCAVSIYFSITSLGTWPSNMCTSPSIAGNQTPMVKPWTRAQPMFTPWSIISISTLPLLVPRTPNGNSRFPKWHTFWPSLCWEQHWPYRQC